MFHQIKAKEQVKDLLEDDVIIFKHSETCPVSSASYGEVQSFIGETAKPVFYCVIQTQEDVSEEIEEKTGVKHETPQIIVWRDGEVSWTASHNKITKKAIEKHV